MTANIQVDDSVDAEYVQDTEPHHAVAIERYRDIARFLQLHDANVPLPHDYSFGNGSEWLPFTFQCTEEQFAYLLHSLPRPVNKIYDGPTFSLSARFGEAWIKAEIPREKVCTSKVVGQETKIVKDFSNVPTKEVIVDIVEWECGPALRELPAAQKGIER